MITRRELDLLQGRTIIGAEEREQDGKRVLRLHFEDSAILAVSPEGNALELSDQSSIR